MRKLFADFVCQSVILLFLVEEGSSILITVPSLLGVLIALWKCQRAVGFRISVKNFTPEIEATRLSKEEDAETLEIDRQATRTVGSALFPPVLLYALYTIIFEEQTGWYNWFITAASSSVYALGFVMMTPQLFLNYKLKSVAHLPWKYLCYKFLNTFIDDLFAFIIRMPLLTRISCFRDDVVFFIYIYQRWIYKVDMSRPYEGSGERRKEEDKRNNSESKKQK